MKSRNKVVVALVSLAAATVGTLGAAAPAQAVPTAHGCPSGAVCIYPKDAGWNHDQPSVFMYSYGAHNLSNQVGNHYVLNNQTDDHGLPVIAILCTGYSGKGCDTAHSFYQWSRTQKKGVSWDNRNLTPINSVVLSPSGP